jgi:hypothetical protein
MDLRKILIWLFISMFIAYSESKKVIFARNTTAIRIRSEEQERLARERESQPLASTIINIPTSCKPGFVFEPTFHRRCRKIAR